MTQASNVTFPFSSGRPPKPTDVLFGSASGTRAPASAAAIAFPPFCKVFHAASFAGKPCSHVERMIGSFLFVLIFKSPKMTDGAVIPIVPVFRKSLRFINL